MGDVIPRWETIPLPPDVSTMSDEERAAYFAHVEDGTVPVRFLTVEEIRAEYGPSMRISNLRSDDSGC